MHHEAARNSMSLSVSEHRANAVSGSADFRMEIVTNMNEARLDLEMFVRDTIINKKIGDHTKIFSCQCSRGT